MAMSARVRHRTSGLLEAEEQWARAVRAERRRWRARVYRGHVWFDEEIRRKHRQLKQSIPVFLREARLRNLLTTPLIYSLAIPFVLLDLWVSLYQTICFPIYGIARVRRRTYFGIDRHKLAYLNAIEKANCAYCSYANGVVEYVREVTARTEQYWCPIKHGHALPAHHTRYRRFFDYGDAEAYRRSWSALRRELRDEPRVSVTRQTRSW